MRNVEKKIIAVSFFILAIVVVWAVVVNISKDKTSSTAKTKIIKSVDYVNNTKEDASSSSKDHKSGTMKKADEGIPIIMYHSISNFTASSSFAAIRITKDNFTAEMKYLKDNSFHTLTMDEAYDYIVNNKEIPKKSVMITFDDGYEDNYTEAYPILKSYGFKATVFVVTSVINSDPGYLTSAQLREMSSNGIDIESETTKDMKLTALSNDQRISALKDSKTNLETILGKKVEGISYPMGIYDDNTVLEAKDAGYKLGFTRDGKWAYKNNGQFKLSRIYIDPSYTENQFENKINSSNQ
ncbi:MAG: polysaccharide deacetylase family protein [Clostridium sp.]|nr:polysaccharide deacetylase family protein [Clostridium sp.]